MKTPFKNFSEVLLQTNFVNPHNAARQNVWLWIVLLPALVFSSCNDIWDCRKGEGPIVRETLTLEEFQRIKLSGSGKVYLSQGEEQQIEVEGQQNIIHNLNRRIRNGLWDIRFMDCVRKHEELVFYITLPNIRALEISGSGEIFGENLIESDQLELDISGSGSLTLDIDVVSLEIDIDGSGKMWLSGISDVADLDIAGSGELNAYDLEVIDYDVRISGSGKADVWAVETLDVKITGSGRVNYKGYPVVNSTITGSGKVVNRN